MSGGWSPISTAPRDGTSVILWMIEDETPPEVPLSVGGRGRDEHVFSVWSCSADDGKSAGDDPPQEQSPF